MTFQSRGNIIFPEFIGESARCYMMPFIQGRPESLPEQYRSYADIVEKWAFEGQEGELGLITIDETYVEAGKSQRGYGAGDRTIHTEACLSNNTIRWGGPPPPSWGRDAPVLLERDLRVLIANSIADTCMVWDTKVEDTTPDGDLSMRAAEFPRTSGRMMASGELMEIGIFTPHEPIPQKHSGNRQFFRIVGKGVQGRDTYFTRNEKLERMGLIAA
jgi:hypothetical protein